MVAFRAGIHSQGGCAPPGLEGSNTDPTPTDNHAEPIQPSSYTQFSPFALFAGDVDGQWVHAWYRLRQPGLLDHQTALGKGHQAIGRACSIILTRAPQEALEQYRGKERLPAAYLNEDSPDHPRRVMTIKGNSGPRPHVTVGKTCARPSDVSRSTFSS